MSRVRILFDGAAVNQENLCQFFLSRTLISRFRQLISDGYEQEEPLSFVCRHYSRFNGIFLHCYDKDC